MQIILSENIGACYGVKRALELADETIKRNKTGRTYTLGPLIHNPQATAVLEKKGLKKIDDISQLRQGTMIIRAHGISPRIISRINKKELRIIDATCPFVKKVHFLAKELYSKGYRIIIIGDPKHSEVIGIAGNVKNAIIISKPEQLKKLPKLKKAAVVSQTTQSVGNFNDIVGKLRQKYKGLVVYNTICSATETRQKSALKIAKKVSLMLVIGGHNSANTKRLADICSKITETRQIETAKDLKKGWLAGKERVGIATGTSTPNWIVDEVINKLKTSG